MSTDALQRLVLDRIELGCNMVGLSQAKWEGVPGPRLALPGKAAFNEKKTCRRIPGLANNCETNESTDITIALRFVDDATRCFSESALDKLTSWCGRTCEERTSLLGLADSHLNGAASNSWRNDKFDCLS